MKNIFKKHTPPVAQPTTVDNTVTSVEVFQATNGCRYDTKEKASSANLLTFVRDELISSTYHLGSYNYNNPHLYERMKVETETIERCISTLTKDEKTFKRFVDAVKETKGYNI